MTGLPPLKSRQVAQGLQALGFEKVRQKGSHPIFHHQAHRRAPLPAHPAKNNSRYLLADILKQLEIDEGDFLKAIGKR